MYLRFGQLLIDNKYYFLIDITVWSYVKYCDFNSKISIYWLESLAMLNSWLMDLYSKALTSIPWEVYFNLAADLVIW